MPYTVFRCRVSAAPATIWAVLLNDLGKQIGEDLDFELVASERRDACNWKRTKATPDGVAIQEFEVNVKEMRITCSLVERLHYKGTNVTHIVAPHWRDPDRQPTLSTSMTWQPLDATGKAPDIRARLRDDVNRLKRLAEETEQRQATQ